tara:strand:- start:475 stop:882 length:408 start_codon:yes stop_codon:yes gene_type:complete
MVTLKIGGHNMNHNEFWDDDEFDFFNTLSDNDKLLYIYDLFLGDFDAEYEMDGRLEYGNDTLETGASKKEKKYVSISLTEGRLSITGPSLSVVSKISNLMMVNGMMFTDTNIDFEDESVVLSYKIVGKTHPMSLN